MSIADFSDPFNPVGWSYNNVETCCNVFVTEEYLFLVERDSDARGIRIIDNSDPRNLQQIGFYQHDDPSEIVASGDYGYIRVRGGYQIIDISDPEQPLSLGAFQNLSGKMTIAGDYLYIAAGEDGIVVIDVSDPETPEQYGYFNTPGVAERISVENNLIYVAEQTHVGIYRLEQPDHASKSTGFIPTEFRLYPPYPNPFNSSTSISYTLPTESAVTLSVYNTRGQLVDLLLDHTMPAGRHDVVWDAKDISAGTYIFELKSECNKQYLKTVHLR